MFAGSHEAAQRGAVMYSFFATCKRNGVDPVKWLEHVLNCILDTRRRVKMSKSPVQRYAKNRPLKSDILTDKTVLTTNLLVI